MVKPFIYMVKMTTMYYSKTNSCVDITIYNGLVNTFVYYFCNYFIGTFPHGFVYSKAVIARSSKMMVEYSYFIPYY
jgi:hypothetical protein